jgi:hypothetical protein
MQDSHRPISLYPHPAANITAFGSTAKRAIPINRKAREARKGALENLEGSNASFLPQRPQSTRRFWLSRLLFPSGWLGGGLRVVARLADSRNGHPKKKD